MNGKRAKLLRQAARAVSSPTAEERDTRVMERDRLYDGRWNPAPTRGFWGGLRYRDEFGPPVQRTENAPGTVRKAYRDFKKIALQKT